MNAHDPAVSQLGRRAFLAGSTALGVTAMASCATSSRPTLQAETLLGPGFHGYVEEGWRPVADAFGAQFAAGKNLGAGICVYRDGRPVVDLWGGLADREANRPWQRDTVIGVASTTKGATAMCAHLLVQRGQLDLDAPVTRYWPEFGAAGKADLPVRYLLSHQAGLPAIDAQLTFEQVCAWDPVIRALEAQQPMWTPGTEHLYHATTYGYLVGEVIKRISGKSPGTFFADEIARPLGLSSWIGLPEEIEPRLAKSERGAFSYDSPEAMVADFAASMRMDPAVAARLVPTLWGPGSVLSRAGSLNGAFGPDNWDSRAFRAAEIPAGNMITDAHSIARMYAATVSEVDGIRILQPDTVARATVTQTETSRMHGVPDDLLPATRNLFKMSLGFWRPSSDVNQMLGAASFGHAGSGGSLGAADPEARVAFGYVPNLAPAVLVDTRANELTTAVRQCLS